MKRLTTAAIALTVVLTAGACGAEDEPAAGPHSDGVDVVYLNHPPVRPVLKDIDEVLTAYKGKISVSRHDLDTAEGEDFAEQHDLSGHVMIAVLIDGEVRFQGFPSGQAPMKSAEGDWKIEDLDSALRQRTGK